MTKIDGNNILSVGCNFVPPKGGIAQVLYTYNNEVYENFQFVPNSCESGTLKKIICAAVALVKTFVTLTFNSKIKIVHIHTASYISFKRSSFFVHLAKFLNRSVVIHIHGGSFADYFNTNPIWIQSVLNKCDRIIALTPAWMTFFQEKGCRSVFVVNNIIPKPTFYSFDKDSMIHLLFMGWIVKEKGIFDLVEVLAEHKCECEGKLMLHVAGNHEIEKLKQMIIDYHMGSLITYEGWISGDEKIRFLNIMDALVLPSYTEGLPISILEALSYGKPVITTPVGGIPEIINESNGYLFEPGNKHQLWKIIKSIINKPEQLKLKYNATKASVKQNMPDSVIIQLMNVYEGLC